MFGHEAALFCPSGTMTNQIAIKVGRPCPVLCVCKPGTQAGAAPSPPHRSTPRRAIKLCAHGTAQ